MMSALLIALAATAVFQGIDGATATSTQSKSRAVATTLAHEDQERMRSMDPRKLSSYSPGPAKRVVNGVEYTITSTADWVSDRTDSESCTKGDGRVTYVKIGSKVEWPEMRGSKPVLASSIVAINNSYAKGSLAVKIIDRNGAGVADVPITVDPPVNQTKNTNAAGCVVFDGLNSGAYTGQFSKLGYVDPNGVNVVRPVNGWNVTTGSTAISTYQYDIAGQANFAFDTTYGTNTWAVTKPDAVTMLHQNVPGPPMQGARLEAVPDLTTVYNFDQLFPFPTPYSAFAGDCSTSAPPAASPGPWPNQSVSIGPGATVGSVATPVTLRLPTVTYKVTRTTSGPTTVNRQFARIRVRPTTGSCIATRTLNQTVASGDSVPTSATDADGRYALPYGNFTVCADDNNGGSTKKNEVAFANDDPNGKSITINIDVRNTASNGTTNGSC